MRLVRLGYPEPVVQDVVARLIEMHYLDDDEFARAWVESRDRARPRGSKGLRRELTLKGVDRSVVESVLAARAAASDTDPDRSAAAALLDRRRAFLEREADPRKRQQKAYALLARSGFDPETCRELTARLVADVPE